MPRFSFRTRLILAMTFVVAGVTAATVLLTQYRLQTTYQHLFEEQFKTQLKFFSEGRLRQLDEAARRCEAVAQSEPVRKALEAGDPEKSYGAIISGLRELYKVPEILGNPAPGFLVQQGPSARPAGPQIAGKILREWQKDPPRRGAISAAIGARQPIIRIINSAGEVLEPKDPRAGLVREAGGARSADELRTFLKMDKSLAGTLRDQEIGYTAVPGPGGKEALHEIIVTPVLAQGSAKFLGALVLGFPVGDFGEHAMYGFSEKSLLSGVWLAGEIYSDTLPAAVRKEVSARVGAAIENKESHSGIEPVMIDGTPHRLFFRVLNPDSPFPPTAQVCLYSMADVIAEQRNLRNLEIGAGSLSLLVAAGLILVISHGFSKPIEQLAEATRRIKEGDYGLNLPVRSCDEIGSLAASFNDMSRDLALKERYKTVLAQVTDREVADQLISGALALGGEVRQVSVLFCDIRGFTALTENMPPAEVITMLNEHMTAMNRIVHLHYGMVDKFVGDLIMAVFGAPKSYGNDALHAVKCALGMVEERRRLNLSSRHRIEIGIGVATGEVVAGCMGSEDRLNYTVLGERVNLASRLCSNAEGCELLIDENTFLQLPADFRVEPTEPLALKGFSLPTAAYRLLGEPAESAQALA